MGSSLSRAVGAADLALLRAARASVGADTAPALRRFSRLGEYGALWLAVAGAGAALDPARRGRWARAGGAVAGTYLVNTAIKFAVRRPRPQLDDLPPLMSTPTQLSFPSAHAATSFAAARALSGGLLPAGPVYAAAAAMAASRVALGVHYPSDVAAGALLGTAIGSLAR